MTKKEVLDKMKSEMPFVLSSNIYPYIEEAMEIYANTQSIEIKAKQEKLLYDLLNSQQEIISSPIRFNGVHVDHIKQLFARNGIQVDLNF